MSTTNTNSNAVNNNNTPSSTSGTATGNVLQKAVEEQAKHLGMDIKTDQEFFWLAKESLNASLPDGWTERKLQRTGQTYYVNKETGESVWEHPSDETYKKRFAALKKLKLEEDAKAKKEEEALKEAATTKKHKDNANSTKVTSVTDYDNMPGSPEVTRLKDELADIRKKKQLLTTNKDAAATLKSIRKEHGRMEKKLKLEEAKKMLKKQSDSFNMPKKKEKLNTETNKNRNKFTKERRLSSVEEQNHRVKTKAWAITWLSRVLDKGRHDSFALRLSFRTWVLSIQKDTEIEKAALGYMKDMALVEDELKARDMLIEQLTIKLTASEDACTTLVDEYSKLQTQIDNNFNENSKNRLGSNNNNNNNNSMMPPQSISGKTHISMVPSPGLNDIINNSNDEILDNLDEGDEMKSSIISSSSPLNSSNATIGNALKVEIGASSNDNNVMNVSPNSSLNEVSPSRNIDSSIISNNSGNQGGTQEEQLERLFSIYATKEHIRKSDKRRGALFFTVDKADDVVMETPKTLTSLRFMRMIRDSKAMDANLQAAQVDIAFRRAVSSSQRRMAGNNDDNVNKRKSSRKRLRFEEFYDVVKELACKKYAPQNEPEIVDLNQEEKEEWWTFKILSEFLFPLLRRHEDRGRTAVTYPVRAQTPNPMTPIGTRELSSRPHQSILDTVDQELASVEGVYGEAEKVSKLEDIDAEIWDDINIEDGPIGVLYKYQDTLYSLFQMHATQDIQYTDTNISNYNNSTGNNNNSNNNNSNQRRNRGRSRSGDSNSGSKKNRRTYIMGRSEFFGFARKYRILNDLLSRIAIDSIFKTSSEETGSNTGLPCLTFRGFLNALMHCAKMAYGRRQDENSNEDMAVAIDAVYRILFRIDPGGKNFKSLQKRYKIFQEKRVELARLMENDLANSRNSVNSNDVNAGSNSNGYNISNESSKGFETKLDEEMDLLIAQKDLAKNSSKPNGASKFIATGKTRNNNFTMKNILGDDDRDENGNLKADIMEIVSEVFDHFAGGSNNTPASSARKKAKNSSNNEDNNDNVQGSRTGVLTIQKFLRIARAARLVDHGKKNIRLPIDLTTLDMVYKRVNLQMRSEPHRMSYDAFQIALCRIARFKYVYVPEQWIEDFETDLFDDESRTRAKDTEALKRLLLDHFVPLGNHLRNQKSIDGNSIDLTESTLNFKSLDSLVKHASELVNLGGQKVM